MLSYFKLIIIDSYEQFADENCKKKRNQYEITG